MWKISQSITCFLAGGVGILGTGMYIEKGEGVAAIGFAIITFAAFALGVWLFRGGMRDLGS